MLKKIFSLLTLYLIILSSIFLTYIKEEYKIETSEYFLYLLLSIIFIYIPIQLIYTTIIQDLKKLENNAENENFQNNFKVTELKIINGKLKKLSNSLHRSNKRKEILIEKLQIINSSKDEIISSISHEFKNPISIISGYIQTILENDLDSKTEKKFLQKINKNALNLSHLIDRLYLITKLDNNKIKLKQSEVDLFELSQQILERLDNDRIVLKGNSSVVECDKDLIEIVINNLLTNSIKYSKEDIIISIENGNVTITDKGEGISQDDLKQIKNKFYRIKKNDWDNSLGLGLAIVEKILNLHNSTLEIKSEIGKGSSFKFQL